MRAAFKILIAPLLVLAVVTFGYSLALAGEGGSVLRVELGRAVDTAAALVFAEKHVSVLPVYLEKEGRGKAVADVVLSPNPLFQRRFVTVRGIGKNGARSYTPVEEATNGNGDETVTAFCSESPRRAAHEQLPLLKAGAISDLVQVRKRKRDVLIERIRAELSPGVLETLRAAEEAYGLRGIPELTQDMPIDDLLRRLEAIQSMAQNRLARKRE